MAMAPAARVCDQATDGDAPYPRPHLTGAAVAVRAAPPGEERVLHGLVDQVRIGAPPSEPQHEPGRMAVVEDAQGAPVTAGQGSEQLRVVPPVSGRRRHRHFHRHTLPRTSGLSLPVGTPVHGCEPRWAAATTGHGKGGVMIFVVVAVVFALVLGCNRMKTPGRRWPAE